MRLQSHLKHREQQAATAACLATPHEHAAPWSLKASCPGHALRAVRSHSARDVMSSLSRAAARAMLLPVVCKAMVSCSPAQVVPVVCAPPSPASARDAHRASHTGWSPRPCSSKHQHHDRHAGSTSTHAGHEDMSAASMELRGHDIRLHPGCSELWDSRLFGAGRSRCANSLVPGMYFRICDVCTPVCQS